MKDTFFNAKLISADTIRVVVFSSLPWEKPAITLLRDHEEHAKLQPGRTSTMNGVAVVDYHLDKPFALGHAYKVVSNLYGAVDLDILDAPFFPGFDDEFAYDGDDLGANYSKKQTVFKLWAPIATDVSLKYRPFGKGKDWAVLPMKRGARGVYEAAVQGDLKGYEYLYVVCNNCAPVEVSDPYAKASTLNGETSYIYDFASFKRDFHEDCLPVFSSPTDAVIYEAHVRDMTISSQTDIEHKGRFLGLVEKGRKTVHGFPAGFDYLVSLGFTHLQLLPIYDYKTVDERHPSRNYNWGYDPAQYFVPEGSYASDLEDPCSRIEDCAAMVAAFHEKGIRIVMDVVFNHVYEASFSTFEKIVPNYYFRHTHNGKRANTSGCGNDLASERKMVHKLIVDAALWWIETYHIDGFRFDLMGIIDVETLQEIERKAKAINPSFLFYGEGWNMGSDAGKPMGNMGNCALLPDFGFFNDFYRETMKDFFSGYGGLPGALSAITGSCVAELRSPMFLQCGQSINYLECHDNGTFFDLLSSRQSGMDEAHKLQLCLAGAAGVLLSLGVPFLHMGQEIGQSKWGEGNTYNKGDDFNKFSYRLLEERYEMAKKVASLIALRKALRFLHASDERIIANSFYIREANGMVQFSMTDPNLSSSYARVDVFFNPSDHRVSAVFDEPQTLLFSSRALEGAFPTSEIDVPDSCVLVTARKRK